MLDILCKASRVLLLFLAVLTVSTLDASATTCRPPREAPEGIEDAKAKADLVFSGYVVSEHMETSWSLRPASEVAAEGTQSAAPVQSWQAMSSQMRSFAEVYGIGLVQSMSTSVTMIVFHVWKGELDDDVEVWTYRSRLRVGNSYLVYAKQDQRGRVGVPACSGTKELNDAMVDVTVLGEPIADKIRAKVAGLLGESR